MWKKENETKYERRNTVDMRYERKSKEMNWKINRKTKRKWENKDKKHVKEIEIGP